MVYLTYYNWWYYDEQTIKDAREQIDMLEIRLYKILEDKEKKNTPKEREEKVNRIKQSIYAIKYTYSIDDIGNCDKIVDMCL